VVKCTNGCSVDNAAAGVVWATRDLRVMQTPALVAAAEAGAYTRPLFGSK
jgi:hypothetical protein